MDVLCSMLAKEILKVARSASGVKLLSPSTLMSGAGLVIGGAASSVETSIGWEAGGVPSALSSTSTRLLPGWVWSSAVR